MENCHTVSEVAADYSLAGLRIRSEIPLSELLPPYQAAEPDTPVTIRIANVPETLSQATQTLEGVAFDGRSLLLIVPTVARYLIRDGSEILVEPARTADANDVRAFLLGSAFATLCHQRSLLPLHSLVIDVPGGCVAFIGASGAGKSTLGAILQKRGYQIIADDVSYLQKAEKHDLFILPGISRIRLWEDTITALQLWDAGVEREFRGYKKFLLPLHTPIHPPTPRRLLRIYRLERAQPDHITSIIKTGGASTIELLMRSVYSLPLAECMGKHVHAFTMCALIAQSVPIFEFRRPMSFQKLNYTTSDLEKHLKHPFE